MLSPITNSPAKIIEELDVSVIKKRYLLELSLSVDKYFSPGAKINICLCPDTGYRFYYPFSIIADADFYNDLQKASKNYYEPWKWENEEAISFIKQSDFILDIGCGDGSFLREMKKRGMYHLYGIDFAVKDNFQNSEGISIKNATIDKYSPENAGKFDVITCFQVLEHITDIKAFMDNCIKCLKPNGKLVIAVPNSHPYIFAQDKYHTLNLPPHHSGLWDKKTLKALCKYFPIEVIYKKNQAIGKDLEYYVNIHISYLSNKSKVLKYILSISLFRSVFGKYMYFKKNKIEGHSIIVVYKKK